MEQTCPSDMQPFYGGTLIRQLNIDVHHALTLKCIKDTLSCSCYAWSECASQTSSISVSELGSEIDESLPVTMVTNNKQRWSLEAYCLKNPC